MGTIIGQSGQWKGKSFIRGGRANVRKALYTPVLVAARFNPDFKAKYQQVIAQGKPAKIAITAVMRKLIVIADTCSKPTDYGANPSLGRHGYSKCRCSCTVI